MRNLAKLILTVDERSNLEFLSPEQREILDVIAEILSRKEIVKEEAIRFMVGQEVDIEKAVEALNIGGLIKFNP